MVHDKMRSWVSRPEKHAIKKFLDNISVYLIGFVDMRTIVSKHLGLSVGAKGRIISDIACSRYVEIEFVCVSEAETKLKM